MIVYDEEHVTSKTASTQQKQTEAKSVTRRGMMTWMTRKSRACRYQWVRDSGLRPKIEVKSRNMFLEIYHFINLLNSWTYETAASSCVGGILWGTWSERWLCSDVANQTAACGVHCHEHPIWKASTWWVHMGLSLLGGRFPKFKAKRAQWGLIKGTGKVGHGNDLCLFSCVGPNEL